MWACWCVGVRHQDTLSPTTNHISRTIKSMTRARLAHQLCFAPRKGSSPKPASLPAADAFFLRLSSSISSSFAFCSLVFTTCCRLLSSHILQTLSPNMSIFSPFVHHQLKYTSLVSHIYALYLYFVDLLVFTSGEVFAAPNTKLCSTAF